MDTKLNRRPNAPWNHCDPTDLVEILLKRLESSALDNCRKSLLITEFEDLLLLFQKRPESVGLFRTDLLGWRTFLKQTPEYMEFSFSKYFNRTRDIVNYVKQGRKPAEKVVPKNNPNDVEVLNIFYRPDVRCVAKCNVSQLEFNEHCKNIDILHQTVSTLRRDIIYAPVAHISRQMKERLLNVMQSIVKISAQHVMDAITLLDHIHFLIIKITHGEELTNEDVECIEQLVDRTEKYASCHKKKGETSFGQTCRNILQINKTLLDKNAPKFPLSLLVKSDFLRLEKIKDCYKKCTLGEMPVVQKEEVKNIECSNAAYNITDDEELSTDLPQPPDSSSDATYSVSSSREASVVGSEKMCESCVNYKAKYGEEYFEILQELEDRPERCPTPDAEDDDEPDGEEVQLGKTKGEKINYVLKKRFKLPPLGFYDGETQLKDVMRVKMDDLDLLPNTADRRLMNPYLFRKRLLRY